MEFDLPAETINAVENRPFWYSERILFIVSLLVFVFFACLLYITEAGNTAIAHKGFLDYLFNSVSVGTLTGLFRDDSGNYTFAGQVVLMFDMLVSAVIASAIASLLLLFVRYGFVPGHSVRSELGRMGLTSRRVILFILLDLAFMWLVGTTLVLISGSSSLWEAIFNALSHILNDGVTALPGNMVIYKNNPSMLLSGILLITLGGWGIGIRGFAYQYIFKILGFKRLARSIPDHLLIPFRFSMVIIGVTVFLQVVGALSLYNFEAFNKALPPTEHWSMLQSYYMSVSARTAGFTISPDLSLLSDKSHFILIALMFIGAASGSFAGGVLKLTAFVYLFVYIISKFRGDPEVRTPGAFIHMSRRTAIEANFRLIGFSFLTFVTTILIFFEQPGASGWWLLFEAISAVSNTGLTLGATNDLTQLSMTSVMFLMIMGKIGFIATTVSFFPKLQHLLERYPEEHDQVAVD